MHSRLLATFGFVLIAVVLASFAVALARRDFGWLVAMVAVSDILGLNIITQAGQAFQAFEQLQWTATINVLMSAGRLAGALILVSIYRHPSAYQWGYIYLGCTAAVTVFSLLLVRSLLWVACDSTGGHARQSFARASTFSASQTSQTLYNDIDKTMLARLRHSRRRWRIRRGLSTNRRKLCAGFRRTCGPPIRISSELAPRESPASICLRQAAHAPGVLYSGAVFVFLLLSSGIVPVILGPEYVATAAALRWLAILPVLKASALFLF